jgi:hypothetical protein
LITYKAKWYKPAKSGAIAHLFTTEVTEIAQERLYSQPSTGDKAVFKGLEKCGQLLTWNGIKS